MSGSAAAKLTFATATSLFPSNLRLKHPRNWPPANACPLKTTQPPTSSSSLYPLQRWFSLSAVSSFLQDLLAQQSAAAPWSHCAGGRTRRSRRDPARRYRPLCKSGWAQTAAGQAPVCRCCCNELWRGRSVCRRWSDEAGLERWGAESGAVATWPSRSSPAWTRNRGWGRWRCTRPACSGTTTSSDSSQLITKMTALGLNCGW